ncbi:hypothetical protein QQF64_020125 [Cirrhinus molitorella]|uniref:HAT C-terminal dimerisation domain-containing protein n=1 Tax=Cirrhinus molitorella TaxID=172907 RepID=A0ABR3L9R4_9TELE
MPGIWNKTGRSYLASEVVEDKCELQIIRPVATRWNSTCLATDRIIRIIDEKGEDSIRSVCDEIKVKMLNPAEVGFLREYCITMKPLLKASSILQSESSVYLGWLLPVIHQLQSKLNRLETSSQTCTPLISALQNGLKKRFGQMLEDPELAAAAVLLPKFKTSWTDKPDVIEAALKYVKNHLETTEQESQHLQRESSDDDDFFSRPLSTKLQSPLELDGYLACASDSMDLLHSFPAIKKLSIKLNTALPASAACERLFSCAGLLFTSKRSRIDSVNFENQLLLKLNKRFRR